MKIVKSKREVREIVKAWKKDGLSVGFVPTMGYLHEGHQSLMIQAAENDRVVVSIFVNPMQFGPTEDLDSYPRDIERDSRLCEESGVDLIFYPEAEEMYESDFCTYVDMSGLTEELCGLSRPAHFRGVCTVVMKLFGIVKPDKSYFGEKDAQQLAVIRQMVRNLDMDIEIVGCPIVREADGLAKSSRNTYLNPEERKAALVLCRSIQAGKELMEAGERNAAAVLHHMTTILQKEPLARIDYLKITDSRTIVPVAEIKGSVLAAMAVFIGRTRLIDNFTFNGTGGKYESDDAKS